MKVQEAGYILWFLGMYKLHYLVAIVAGYLNGCVVLFDKSVVGENYVCSM